MIFSRCDRSIYTEKLVAELRFMNAVHAYSNYLHEIADPFLVVWAIYVRQGDFFAYTHAYGIHSPQRPSLQREMACARVHTVVAAVMFCAFCSCSDGRLRTYIVHVLRTICATSHTAKDTAIHA